jgi:hypothetical protein
MNSISPRCWNVKPPAGEIAVFFFSDGKYRAFGFTSPLTDGGRAIYTGGFKF